MSCFGGANYTVTYSDPDAFVVLREMSKVKSESLWKNRQKVYKSLKKSFTGKVCVFRDSEIATQLDKNWMACTGRDPAKRITKVQELCSWVDLFPGKWEYGQVYILNPLQEQGRPDNKVPCFLLHKYDDIYEDWHSNMFCRAMSLCGARYVEIVVASMDGAESSRMVHHLQGETTKSNQGRYSLPRLSLRSPKENFVLDYSALEEYVRLFGTKMISSHGKNTLRELTARIKDTGKLGVQEKDDNSQPDISWVVETSVLDVLRVNLGATTLSATLPGAVGLSHSLAMEIKDTTQITRRIQVNAWLQNDNDVMTAMLEKLTGIESFMEQQTIFQEILGSLVGIVSNRPLRDSAEDKLARTTVRVVVLGARGAGKSAMLYTLKLIGRLLSPCSVDLKKAELLDILKKPDELVFNKAGRFEGRCGTKQVEEYVVAKKFYRSNDDQPETAELIVGDTPGTSMKREDHTARHNDMMDMTWKYVAGHIRAGEVEKISPILVFNAKEVAEVYKRLVNTGEKGEVNELLKYLGTLLEGLEKRGSGLDDIVLVGTHADMLKEDAEIELWNSFSAAVSDRCSEEVSSFLVHNFEDRDDSNVSEKHLEEIWNTLRSAFVYEPKEKIKARADQAQRATLGVLDCVRSREKFAIEQAEDGLGLVELFSQHSVLLTGQRR